MLFLTRNFLVCFISRYDYFHFQLLINTHRLYEVHIYCRYSRQFESILGNKLFSLVGDITIPGGMTLTVDSDLNGASPRFTLTCISTGGPATTVTWTRESATDIGDPVTVLTDNETATYTHTLTVTGRTEGLYRCNVSNSKPSSAAAELSVAGIVYSL